MVPVRGDLDVSRAPFAIEPDPHVSVLVEGARDGAAGGHERRGATARLARRRVSDEKASSHAVQHAPDVATAEEDRDLEQLVGDPHDRL